MCCIDFWDQKYSQNKNSHIKGSWMKLCCHQLQNEVMNTRMNQ